jgi:Eukaryotic aspartyl protease
LNRKYEVLICFIIVAALVLLTVDALRVEKRDDPAVVKLPLQKKVGNLGLKQRQEVESPDINYMQQLLYIVQLQIGTPPQSTYVQLDTGSSDLIVETPLSDICSAAAPNPCTNFGSCTKSLIILPECNIVDCL